MAQEMAYLNCGVSTHTRVGFGRAAPTPPPHSIILVSLGYKGYLGLSWALFVVFAISGFISLNFLDFCLVSVSFFFS